MAEVGSGYKEEEAVGVVQILPQRCVVDQII